MDTKELLKKVRKIEIKTRRLSNHIFGGEYHSTFKGRGMTFSEVREYAPGDEVRTIVPSECVAEIDVRLVLESDANILINSNVIFLK